MSDGKTPEAPLVPGTDAYNAAMIAKADAGIAEIRMTTAGPDGKPVTLTAQQEPVVEAAMPARPEWCPEKFWNAETGIVNSEALAKSYGELEKGRGKPALTDPVKPTVPAAPVKSAEQTAAETEVAAAKAEAEKATDDATKAAAKTKVDAAQAKLDAANKAAEAPKVSLNDVVSKATAEYAEKGEMSAETYASLEARGLSREYVDNYVDGLKARAEVVTTKVYAEAGGEDNYKAIQAWAAANLTVEEVAAANAAFNSGDFAVVVGQVRTLKSRYDSANGTSAAGRIEGKGGAAGVTAGDPFTSKEQVTAAMRDKRYNTDPAYRKSVENRLSASMKANIDLGF